MMRRLLGHKWWPWLAFFGLALVLLGPLLAPGYILSVDLSWGPHLPPPEAFSNTAPLMWVLAVLSWGLPVWVIEKLVLVAIFVTAGVGMWRLAGRTASGLPAYFAGALYVVNPFVYERLMAGHWLILAGYSLLPWFVDSLVAVLERPGVRRALVLAGWSTGIGILALHVVPMAVVVTLAVVVAWGWGRMDRLRSAWKPLGVAGAVVMAASAVWLVPWLLQRSPGAQLVTGFDAGQYEAFRTTAGPLGAPAAVATLQGFWGERTGITLPPYSVGIIFWVGAVIILTLVVCGFVRAVRRRDRLGLALAVAAVVAWVMALGVAWPPAAAVTSFLVEHLPFYRGFREPQKWVAVIALAYAYLAASGLQLAMGYWNPKNSDKLSIRQKVSIFITSIVAVYAFSPLQPLGAAGQLKSVSYPSGWAQLNDRLNQLPHQGDSGVLILPWHQYIYLNFAKRPVANPAPLFFDRPVIISNDPELPGVSPAGGGSIVAQVQKDVIDRRYFVQNAGTRLAALGVHYIVLLLVSDQPSYDWLDTQSDLKLIAETPDWKLYEAVP